MKTQRHVVFLVAEDWYFCLHWLPIAKAVRDSGYRVSIITKVDKHAAQIESADLSVVHFDLGRGQRNPLTEWRRIRHLTKVYRDLSPDLIHHIGLKAIALGSYAGVRAKVGTSINLFAGLGYLFANNGIRIRVMRTLVGHLLSGRLKSPSSLVQTLNRDDCQRLAADGWIDPSRASVLPGSGIDLNRFTPLPPPTGNVVTLAVVARMLRIKGIDTIVEAFQRVLADGVPCRLLLVGKPDPANPSSFSQNDLERWASLPGIEWRGFVEDVRTIWQEADIAVLGSQGGEGVPVSLMEASACCRPSIATNTPGCRDIVINDSTGMLVEPNNVNDLSYAINVLVADTKKRLRFGATSRQLVETNFASDRVAVMVLQDYRRLGLAP